MSANYLQTPLGKFPIQSSKKKELDSLSDKQLLDKFFEEYEESGFIPPFLFNEIKYRGLYSEVLKRKEEKQEERYLEKLEEWQEEHAGEEFEHGQVRLERKNKKDGLRVEDRYCANCEAWYTIGESKTGQTNISLLEYIVCPECGTEWKKNK